jgi:hypothetical protein
MDEYYEDKCNAILEWAKGKPGFDPEFVENMLDVIEGGGELTERQGNAIDNIISKWRIEI